MNKEKTTLSFKWILLKMRPVLRWLIKARSSPRNIAGGFAVGVFIAFTPTIGLQIVLAILLASVLKLNQPAAIFGACITNPITFPIIFTFNYWLGNFFWKGPSVSTVSNHLIDLTAQIAQLDIWNIKEQFLVVSQLGSDIIAPLLLGCFIAGIVSAGLSYVVLGKLLEAFFARRAKRRNLKGIH